MTELPDWMRGQVLLGKHDDEYVVVKLEENGELNVLLKGAYDDELRTVKLDDQGRLSAFVIDSVDAWGEMLSCGNAELAARLGSPIRYEQGGRIFFTDSFENGLGKWRKALNGDDAAAEITPLSYCTGGYSCRLTAGSDGEARAGIYREQGFLPQGRLGVTLSFDQQVQFVYFQVLAEARSEDMLWEYGWQWHSALDKLKIYDEDGNWTEYGTQYIATGGLEIYNTVKLVVDLDENKYVKIRFNADDHDLSAWGLKHTANGYIPRLYLYIKCQGEGPGNEMVDVDDVILTIAEP